jgi:hypothetical protein
MKTANILSVTAGLLLASVAWTGCSQSGQDKTEPGSSIKMIEEVQTETVSRLNGAKLYCVGMLLYAEQHQNECPTNLSQTLPYLSSADRPPGLTTNFEILYHGSFDKLPNPMTNGIIVIRSDSWQTPDGKRVRIYGFADGHCEAHFAHDGDFSAWEKQHSLSP